MLLKSQGIWLEDIVLWLYFRNGQNNMKAWLILINYVIGLFKIFSQIYEKVQWGLSLDGNLEFAIYTEG